MLWIVLCFKQKRAYEMRISDWSSDVCASDLSSCSVPHSRLSIMISRAKAKEGTERKLTAPVLRPPPSRHTWTRVRTLLQHLLHQHREAIEALAHSSAERRVGTECVSPCSSLWSPYP